jgi:cytochrome d ubiquinol oxidase subunit II
VDAIFFALFWAAVVALAILIYVILDGFGLGIGVLFGTTRDEAHRSAMMNSIAPYWDGNQTWLVMIGVGLFGGFPVVYAVFLGAFYIPLLLLLAGIIFRGVAFEYRDRSVRMRPVWDKGFSTGSTVVAFVQGAAIGGVMRGLPVQNGQFAGDSMYWLAPFPLLTGLGLVLGYALLGAGWLVLKSEGELRDWAYARIRWLAGGVLLVLSVAASLTLDYSELAQGQWNERRWGLVFPVIGAVALLTLLRGTRRRNYDFVPFAATVLFFFASFATLAVMFWPYMIPYSITIASAAAPEASLSFLFYGAGIIMLPVIAGYTIRKYWIFRGKATKLH